MPNTPAPDSLFLALQGALAGRYSLERELGRGGMGIVYLARDVRLDRPVALKLLPPERATNPTLRERFLHEARMAARLAHPNIVAIHAVEEAGEFVFYAMRYVAGETLGDRLRRTGRLAPHHAARILRDTAYALAYAHAQGVIHRDVKPDNILLEQDGDRALVTDFGIARLMESADAGGRIMGTPEYIAPEQAAGEPADRRSDLYSLGAVGFHCLAGRPPFAGTVAQVLLRQRLEAPAPLLDVAPETPSMLATAIDRALAKRPADRFDTAEAMADALAPTPVSTELPVPVRVWIERGRELKGMYVIWSCFFFGVSTIFYVNVTIQSAWSLPTAAFLFLLGNATIAPWVGHGLWRISQTRRAFEAGVTFDDLRHGLDVAVARREEELRYESSRPVHWLPRLVRTATYATLFGAIGSLAAGMFLPGPGPLPMGWFGAFGAFTMATVGGALFGLVFPGRRLPTRAKSARLRRKFWDGPIGRIMARIATVGLPAARHTAWATWRPTEAALGSATETLFSRLPEAERDALADLPQVVARLEREAALARTQRDRGAEGPWSERLEQAVAAIETLRVGLLRVAAGDAATGTLTADLDAARELSERIDYLMAGANEVAELLAPDDGSRQNATQAQPMRSAASTSLG